MRIRNQAGQIPTDLLDPVLQEEHPMEQEEEDNADSWHQKLLGECEAEAWEAGGYEEDFNREQSDYETYDAWAERIVREYTRRRGQGAGLNHGKPEDSSQGAGPSRGKAEPEPLRRPMEVEADLYRAREAAKARELQEARRRRCEEAFTPGATSLLTYHDIPWPCPGASPEAMAAAAMMGADPGDRASFRRQLRRQQALWHPDKFTQRCGERLAQPDRRRVLDAVMALSQALNRLAESVK
ncbi:NF-kappa-B inhibitor-like protein 1 isoform X1 [Alligator sinensis]|uniref:NF-kappa-B inhibitor-like protein 1 isoform X1 n=2 Tax=Alligator sinensis TaxID=38654 RepID=A0A3Q0FLK2_ALLSI|nr:NF-kappa-B inhibitor-like protein 1 isoform X1 [Alligator sinensis]XP_025048143.1 NF-kappa-B inhibitor-like protein 1 isoform X1 [Alligator sinensis]